MAETKTINLEVNSNLNQTEKSVTSLKSELRKAQAEVAAMSDKFGATSKEATEAAKRAAELKDRIGDAAALTEAFNPDAKFKALTASLGGVAGGFSAVQGAMGLLGTESQDVEKMILKVQSAMAISQGIQAVGESIDSFKQLGAVIQNAGLLQKANIAITATAATIQKLFTGAVDTTATSFKGLRAAIISTGIGALVVALGYLASKMMESGDATEELTDKQKRLNDELEYYKQLTDETSKSIDYYTNLAIANAKKRGASEKELLKIQLDALEEKGKANQKEYEDIVKNQDKVYGLTKEQNKRLQELRQENLNLQRQGNLLLADADAELAQKSRDNRKKQADEARQEAKRLREEAEKERIEFEKAKGRRAEEEYDAILKREEEARERNRQSGLTEIEQVQDKYDKLIKIAKDAGVSTTELEIERENELNEIKLKNQEENAKKQLAVEQAIADGKKAIQESTLSNIEGGIGLLKGLFEKNKVIQKGLILAESAVGIARVINNTAAADGADAFYAAQMGPVAGPPYLASKKVLNRITAGISIASNLAATAKALSALGGGGAGSKPSMDSGGGAAPRFNVVGNAGVNQIAETMNRQAQSPIQAYVVANNVTTAQSLNRNIVQNASLG